MQSMKEREGGLFIKNTENDQICMPVQFTQTHTYTHKHTHIHTHTYTQTLTHANRNTHTHTQMYFMQSVTYFYMLRIYISIWFPYSIFNPPPKA